MSVLPGFGTAEYLELDADMKRKLWWIRMFTMFIGALVFFVTSGATQIISGLVVLIAWAAGALSPFLAKGTSPSDWQPNMFRAWNRNMRVVGIVWLSGGIVMGVYRRAPEGGIVLPWPLVAILVLVGLYFLLRGPYRPDLGDALLPAWLSERLPGMGSSSYGGGSKPDGRRSWWTGDPLPP